MLKHCAANRKRRLSALPNVGPYIYDVKISGFTRNSIYIYDISSLRVNVKWVFWMMLNVRFGAVEWCNHHVFLVLSHYIKVLFCCSLGTVENYQTDTIILYFKINTLCYAWWCTTNSWKILDMESCKHNLYVIHTVHVLTVSILSNKCTS